MLPILPGELIQRIPWHVQERAITPERVKRSARREIGNCAPSNGIRDGREMS
jgi:hypothetical protein